ncbi:MAG: hypothetical protein JO010_13840, partial [Alphaproteobacteria bacterium]|nr:hypothetical protein [Alphaproteobacteria bacterium]
MLRFLAVALALAVPLPAAAQSSGVPPAGRAQPIPPIDTGPAIPIVPAADLVERGIVDSTDAPAGRIAHILVDPASGALRYAMIAGTAASDRGTVLPVVPWARLAPIAGAESFRLAMTGSELA